MDDVVIFRGRLRRYSVKEAGVDELLQEELNVSEFRVLDSERFEHAEVAVLNRHEHGAQMFQIRPHQVEGRAEVFDSLRFWNNGNKHYTRLNAFINDLSKIEAMVKINHAI